MIARIEGHLEAVVQHTALVRMEMAAGAVVVHEVLLSAYTAARLLRDVGQTVKLHTLYYMEGQNQGAMFLPRLVGFLTVEDRQFYELFTTCKGIGYRRALRAMTLSTDVIAAAIAERDLDLLQSLPEIGRRMAETIVTTLRGKVDHLVAATSYPARQGDQPSKSDDAAFDAGSHVAREALKVLLQLGETRQDAMRWIDQALLACESNGEPRPASPEELIAKVYRIKAGA